MKKITGTDIQGITAVLGMLMSIVLMRIDKENIAIGFILFCICSISFILYKNKKSSKKVNK